MQSETNQFLQILHRCSAKTYWNLSNLSHIGWFIFLWIIVLGGRLSTFRVLIFVGKKLCRAPAFEKYKISFSHWFIVKKSVDIKVSNSTKAWERLSFLLKLRFQNLFLLSLYLFYISYTSILYSILLYLIYFITT